MNKKMSEKIHDIENNKRLVEN